MELATKSGDRQTKVAACELLHSLILLCVGRSATQPTRERFSLASIYKKLFPSILQLACDVDLVSRFLRLISSEWGDLLLSIPTCWNFFVQFLRSCIRQFASKLLSTILWCRAIHDTYHEKNQTCRAYWLWKLSVMITIYNLRVGWGHSRGSDFYMAIYEEFCCWYFDIIKWNVVALYKNHLYLTFSTAYIVCIVIMSMEAPSKSLKRVIPGLGVPILDLGDMTHKLKMHYLHLL